MSDGLGRLSSMPARKKPRRWLRWAVGITTAVFFVALFGALTIWMATQRVPGWYRPVDVAGEELSRVRNSLPNTYQDFTDLVVRGEVFDFAISDKTVTEWIVARGELYPEAREWLPDWFRDPVVHFDEDKCIVGARLQTGMWQAIVGIHLKAEVTREAITLRIEKVTAGSVPIPLSQFEKPLRRLLSDKRLDADLMPDPLSAIVRKLQDGGAHKLLSEGVSWPNLFQTANSRRVVKIVSLSAANGELRAGIEPR